MRCDAAYASGDERAVAVALDGLKTANAYLGELASLVPLLSELEPLLRRQNDLWRLSWTVQESAFAAIAAGRWDEALTRIEEARRHQPAQRLPRLRRLVRRPAGLGASAER